MQLTAKEVESDWLVEINQNMTFATPLLVCSLHSYCTCVLCMIDTIATQVVVSYDLVVGRVLLIVEREAYCNLLCFI